jgi:hypothetical protein
MQYSKLSEVSKKNLETYLTSVEYRRWYWQDFFTPRINPNLRYDTLIGSKGAPVAADVVAIDSSAPLKRRQAIKKLTGDIPPVKIARELTEADLYKYRELKNMATPDQQQIIELVFGDVDYCFNGCMARMEWFALRALSYGKFTLSKSNNAGIITEDTIDYNMASANKEVASVAWSASASSTKPITDIIGIQEEANAAGVTLKYMLMTPTTWSYFAASTETQNYTLGTLYGGAKIKLSPTLDDANRMLRDRDLPQIIIVNTSITTEVSGTQTSSNPWRTGHVLLIPDLNVGRMEMGPIATEEFPPEQITSAKRDGVFVYKYHDVDPVREVTVGEITAFPSWESIDQCWNLDTLSTTDWDA